MKIHLRTVSDAEKLASALRRVRHFWVHKVDATMEAWRSFWHSTAMAKNVSLVSFKIDDLSILDYSADGFDEFPRPLSVVSDCLQRNFFLEDISVSRIYGVRFSSDDALGRTYVSAWNGHIEPLLEMNRKHDHRLATSGETRLFMIRARLLQICSHPKKLFKILRDYPREIFPNSVTEHLNDLDQCKADPIESQNEPRAETIHRWAEDASIKRQLSRLQAEADLPRR